MFIHTSWSNQKTVSSCRTYY